MSLRNLKDDLNHWKENYSDRWLTPDYDDFIELCREADNYVPEAIERALISEEKYLSEEEHRIHWENRAKLAEAEVERLRLHIWAAKEWMIPASEAWEILKQAEKEG